jgi:outer membrane protein OmpA-like peptidoglycan-associated protein
MKISGLLYIILFSFSVLFGGKTLKQANKAYKQQAYRQAIVLYEEYAKGEGKEVPVPEIATKMGHCYFFLNDFLKAKEYFEMAGTDKLKGDDLAAYIRLLVLQGDFKNAAIFINNDPENAGIKRLSEQLTRLDEKKQDTSLYKVLRTDINTFGQSFGVQYYRGGVVFSSSSSDVNQLDYRPVEKEQKDAVDQKGFTFLNLFYSPLINDGELGKPVLFSESLKFQFHVGAVSFSPDKKTMYYTKAVKAGDDNVLKIFSASLVGGAWQGERMLNFNSNLYSCAHPAVSVTGDTLFFVSDMPNGKGGKDIYFSRRMGNLWSLPVNFSLVNTPGDEVFPFVSNNNVLYFSSDFHPGYGGLDVFKCDYKSDNKDIINLGFGVNSRFDDFAFVLNPDSDKEGFLSSNRSTGGRYDDIFRLKFETPAPQIVQVDTMVLEDEELSLDFADIQPVLTPLLEIECQASNGLSGEPLANVLIIIRDELDNSLIFEGITDKDGKSGFKIDPDLINPYSDIRISAVAKSGFEKYERVQSGEALRSKHSSFTDIQIMPVIEKTQTITIPQNKLNFALGSAALSYEAKKVLERWYEYMKDKDNVRLRLNAHTDAQGDNDFNLGLSQRRADAAKEYLVQRGIDGDKIIARGYGERYILNHCKDGVRCSDAEHEVNRRLEIMIIVD